MKDLINLHNSGNFPEDSSLGSHLRDLQFSVAIILDLFWVVFYEILTQMCSSLYKNFTIDAMQVNAYVMVFNIA